jgi:hypothetical protein
MFTKESTFKISQNIVSREMKEGAYLLLEISGDHLFELSDVAAVVWTAINNGKSYGEILQSVSTVYEMNSTDEADVKAFIEELLKAKIISL